MLMTPPKKILTGHKEKVPREKLCTYSPLKILCVRVCVLDYKK